MNAIKGIITLGLVIVNTLINAPLLLIFSFLKFLIPISKVQFFLSKTIIAIAEIWISINSGFHRWMHGDKIEILNVEKLDPNDWYLVVSNHISAADIPIVQSVLNKKIPFLKFFLKRELIWVPFLGLAWWALDFPFMRRYSREFIEQNPHLKGKDLEETQKSCEKFKQFPISVMNYIEGTRFSEAKKQKQNSQYENLLTPKAGGIGFVLGSMGQQLNTLLLVSIKYFPKPPTMWEYLAGSYEKSAINIQKIVIPESIKNKNYITDEDFKQELQNWVNKIWKIQDETISGM